MWCEDDYLSEALEDEENDIIEEPGNDNLDTENTEEIEPQPESPSEPIKPKRIKKPTEPPFIKANRLFKIPLQKSISIDQIQNRTGSKTIERSKNIKCKLIQIMINGTFWFKCQSETNPGKYWDEYIFPVELFKYCIMIMNGQTKKFTDQDWLKAADEIIHGNLRVYCSCPAFQMWGASFLNSKIKGKLGQAETRPLIRNINPDIVGHACKHLLAALKEFETLEGTIAKLLGQNKFNVKLVDQRYRDNTTPRINNF